MNSNFFYRLGLPVLIAVLLVASICRADADDAANSATEEQIAAAIEQIGAAERARDASEAYAGVARHASKSVELRVAYVEKLVELGSADLAYSAVLELVKLDGSNAFAQGVFGYCLARQGDYGPAAEHLSEAAKLGASDEPTMENLGQLLAYLDNDPKAPVLSDAATLTVAAGKEGWGANAAYQRGYERMSAGFNAYAEAEAEIAAEIEAIKTKSVELEAEVNSLNSELASIAAERQRIHDASSDDNGNQNVGGGDADSGATPGGGVGAGQQEVNDPNTEALQALYERESKIYAKIGELKVQIRGLGRDLNAAKRRLERLPRERRAIMREAQAEFAFVAPVLERIALPVPDEAGEAGDGEGQGAQPASDAIVIDNDDGANIAGEGEWMVIPWDGSSHGATLLHDNNTNKGANAVGFIPDLPAAGEYDVYMYFPAVDFAATNVPVEVVHAGGATTVTVNQRTSGGQWLHLGKFTFNQGTGGAVIIRTTGTDGHVFADAVKFQPVAGASPPVVEPDQPEQDPAPQE